MLSTTRNSDVLGKDNRGGGGGKRGVKATASFMAGMLERCWMRNNSQIEEKILEQSYNNDKKLKLELAPLSPVQHTSSSPNDVLYDFFVLEINSS